jgi:hypothetical protein
MQAMSSHSPKRWKGSAMKHLTRVLFSLVAGAAFVGVAVTPGRAAGPSPDQLAQAGWTCVRPLADPTREICASPGQGLPPLPGSPGFADRAPSYELLVFEFATGDMIGVQHLLRPDIYFQGMPPCPQQPNGAYVYIPRNDTWSCFRPT